MEGLSCKLAENEVELAGAMDVRRQVFVREQGISEDLVYDGHDDEAMHLVVKQRGGVIGTARVRFTGPGEAKLERMAVLKPYRSTGIGLEMMSFLMSALSQKQVEKVILHAQQEVAGFYRRCGFSTVGSPFMEVGIRHIKMEKKL